MGGGEVRWVGAMGGVPAVFKVFVENYKLSNFETKLLLTVSDM